MFYTLIKHGFLANQDLIYIIIITNRMIFLVQFGINEHYKLHSPLHSYNLVVFEKMYSFLFIQNCTRNHVITYTYQLVVDRVFRVLTTAEARDTHDKRA